MLRTNEWEDSTIDGTNSGNIKEGGVQRMHEPEDTKDTRPSKSARLAHM